MAVGTDSGRLNNVTRMALISLRAWHSSLQDVQKRRGPQSRQSVANAHGFPSVPGSSYGPRSSQTPEVEPFTGLQVF